MGCASCSKGETGKPSGCNSNGGCGSGGCNRLNTFDWLSKSNFYDPLEYNVSEVSFKNGARKGFFWKGKGIIYNTGDMVAVETGNGYDIGRISLSGELVRAQMKKKSYTEDRVVHKILRLASERDIDKMHEAREKEKEVMIQARVIARSIGLNMKVGDVEYQADHRKATIYYTAEGRIDFRELVRQYAKEFRVKIEMRQIGSRQESSRIGGIGSCGRELCCSTWLTEFKSVNTTAARYQNLAINQSKLSGQCGRLKCCLNYELDTYMDALKHFPKKADVLKTKSGNAYLIKTDIFRGIMFYALEVQGRRGMMVPMDKEIVKEILELNAKGEMPDTLEPIKIESNVTKSEEDLDFADVTGDFELPEEKRRPSRRKKSNSRNRNRNQSSDRPKNKARGGQSGSGPKSSEKSKAPQSNAGANKSKKTPTSGGRNKNRTKPNQNKK